MKVVCNYCDFLCFFPTKYFPYIYLEVFTIIIKIQVFLPFICNHDHTYLVFDWFKSSQVQVSKTRGKFPGITLNLYVLSKQ